MFPNVELLESYSTVSFSADALSKTECRANNNKINDNFLAIYYTIYYILDKLMGDNGACSYLCSIDCEKLSFHPPTPHSHQPNTHLFLLKVNLRNNPATETDKEALLQLPPVIHKTCHSQLHHKHLTLWR